jgi:hypothetical protein
MFTQFLIVVTANRSLLTSTILHSHLFPRISIQVS